ncbi:efflux RND transporter periplasmic adaptor subunit [Chlorobium sp. KB01]|uniref:efflux RND transporter periplasmic adaptor subunit n=1 Tax=Chlorobium sp. KB01 TaxID=1917528 RepID=UPI00097666CC|nr:HlyD family efflux transporter periplasmic adaptor subunit [Chlorobium sp. KB01]
MVKRNRIIAAVLAVIIVAGVTGFLLFRGAKNSGQRFEEIRPARGSISSSVSTTGAVEPENRVKIKSSVGGRVEEVLVDEGQLVSKGTVLAMLSSTERAALLDAARLQGKSEQGYWNNVYKKTAVIAPMDGQVIVRSVNPGQTVTTSDSLFVLSDHLIVKAYVDETDIGRVKTGQRAVIGLDAYPEIRVNGVVEHIYYESRLQNNVSIYNVDVIPDRIPEVFRSGMSANIRIIVQEHAGSLLLPQRAVQSRNGSQVVMQKKRGKDGGQRYTRVKTGLLDDGKIEILSGITDSSVVLLPDSSFVLPKKSGGRNPFTPQRSRR